MTTINGRNKQERLINKAKKYINVDITSSSNKYNTVRTNDEDVLIAAQFVPLCTANGPIYKVIVENYEKPLWVPIWAGLETSEGLVFKPYKPTPELISKLAGCDGFYRLKDHLRTVKIEKGWTANKRFIGCE